MSAKPNIKSRFLVAMLTMALIAMASVRVEAQPYDPAQSYDPSNVARLSTIVDEAYVLGKDDVAWSYAEPNLTLEKGDLLRTNESGMAEIQFDSTLLIRIGENSRAALVEMGNDKVVGVDSGRVYLRATKAPDEGKGFFLTFPSGQLFTIGPTLARLDVDETGAAEVRVVRGEVGLVTKPDGARSIPAGGSVSLDPAGKSIQNAVLAAHEDAFDYWSEQRDIALSTVTRPKQVPNGVVGAEDLNQYGEWVYSDTYGNEAWKPYVVEDWRPYGNGRWIYNSYGGWTWVPDEPWGYTTYHYGSWNYDPYYGWIWVPGPTWYPARVSWVSYDGYVGWVPVGYYGYPVVTTYPYYVSTSYVYYPDLLTFSFVLYDDFYDHHYYYDHDHHDHHDHHDGDHHDGDHHWDDGDHHDGDHHWDDGDHHDGGGDHGGHHGDDNGEVGGQPHRWTGGNGDRAIDRYTTADRQQMRQHVNDLATGNDGRSITPINGDNIDMNKLKDAKLRFASSAGDLNIKKIRQKGVPTLQKIDQENIVDVAGRPELKQKIAKLNTDPRRAEKLKTVAASNELPKRTIKDTAKKFDFRSADLKKIDSTRVRDMVADRSNGKVSTNAAKQAVEGFSRRSQTQTDFNRREIMQQVEKARKNPSVERASAASVQRITITNDDLRQEATRFKRERDSSRGISERPSSQVSERISQRWSSENLQQGRETLSRRFGTDREVTGAKTSALQQRASTRAANSDPAINNRFGRFNSEEARQERQSIISQRAGTTNRPTAITPQVQSPRTRSYGEALQSRSFSRSDSMRSVQQMSRPTAPARSMSQPQINSREFSRGGDRSFSGRSDGGNFTRGQAARAVGRARANRR